MSCKWQRRRVEIGCGSGLCLCVFSFSSWISLAPCEHVGKQRQCRPPEAPTPPPLTSVRWIFTGSKGPLLRLRLFLQGGARTTGLPKTLGSLCRHNGVWPRRTVSTLFMTVLGQPAFAGDIVGQASLYLLNNYCKTFICMTLKIFTTYPRVTKQTLQVGKHGLVSCEGLPHRPWS